MVATFIGTSAGMIASNYVYQAFRAAPDWALATERSWFQVVALIAVGIALAISNSKAA